MMHTYAITTCPYCHSIRELTLRQFEAMFCQVITCRCGKVYEVRENVRVV